MESHSKWSEHPTTVSVPVTTPPAPAPPPARDTKVVLGPRIPLKEPRPHRLRMCGSGPGFGSGSRSGLLPLLLFPLRPSAPAPASVCCPPSGFTDGDRLYLKT